MHLLSTGEQDKCIIDGMSLREKGIKPMYLSTNGARLQILQQLSNDVAGTLKTVRELSQCSDLGIPTNTRSYYHVSSIFITSMLFDLQLFDIQVSLFILGTLAMDFESIEINMRERSLLISLTCSFQFHRYC
jgi:hypothetical protein